jgi:hypothetical protein
VTRLKQVGIYDKALIVITADNGESFLHPNHDRHVADAVTFTDIASTPLYIKRPNQQSGQGYDDRHVTTFDVVPTIAAAAGLKMPWKVQGHSILAKGNPAPVAVYREQGKKGKVFKSSLPAYDAARAKALERKTTLFAHGLYGIGPNPDLIGKSVSDLNAARSSTLKATITAETRTALGKVNTKSSFLPANITGRIGGSDAKRGLALALALNGKVAAVGWSAQLSGDPRFYFSFFAPPDDFKDGANTVQLYSIGPSGQAEEISG